MGGFRTGTSRYSEQILSVDAMENNFKWNKTRKGGKNVYEANQPEKKTKKRERDRHSHELNPLSAGIFH